MQWVACMLQGGLKVLLRSEGCGLKVLLRSEGFEEESRALV